MTLEQSKMSAMFLGGAMPSMDAMETFIASLDEQLEQNANELEDCVTEIFRLTNKVPGMRSGFEEPTDMIHFMTQGNLMEKTSCYDPESEDITRLLRNLLHILEKNPGSENEVLQSLLELSEKEGVSLPIRSSITDHVTDSLASLNLVTDSGEQVNESLWEELTMKLRRYFIEKLHCDLRNDEIKSKITLQERLEYVQSLCALCPHEEIWSRYKSLRLKQLSNIFTQNFSHTQLEDNVTFSQIAEKFPDIAGAILVEIQTDFDLLISGVFKKTVQPFSAIHEIYLTNLTDELGTIVETVEDELAKINLSGPPGIPKSDSVEAPKGKFKFGYLRKGISNSLDSLLTKSGDSGGIESFLKKYLPGLCKIVSRMRDIEVQISHLKHTVSWDVTSSHVNAPSKANLKGVLKPRRDPSPMSTLSNNTSLNGSFDIPPPFGVTQHMMSDHSSLVRVVEKGRPEDTAKWDWREVFKPLIPQIAKAVESEIREVCGKAIDDLDLCLKDRLEPESIELCQDVIGGRLDFPKYTFKSAKNIVSSILKLLPLVKVGNLTPFHVVRSTYIDTVVLNLRNYSMKLSKLSGNVPSSHSLNTLYLSLCSAAYIRNHLYSIDSILASDDSSKKVFPLLYRQFCEQVDVLSQQIADYHVNALVTSIFHDAEGNYWSDTKEFYESERCNFTIQMWHLHMVRLRHDLWRFCPPKLSQNLFVSVLHDSLSHLSKRYIRCKPSYKRTTQFRVDITAILLCTSELLMSGCNSIGKYIDACTNETLFYGIHSICLSLLAAVAVVASPLDQIYKIFKKGFLRKKKRHHGDTIENSSPVTEWLHWIRPALFNSHEKVYDDIQTTTAVYLQVKLLAAQPEPNWVLTLQALLMKDFTLTILLAMQCLENSLELNSKPAQTRPKYTGCLKEDCPGSDCITGTLSDLQGGVFNSLLQLLAMCDDIPGGLSKAMLPVISRSDGWMIFDMKCVPGRSFPDQPHLVTPNWLRGLYDVMMPFINRLIKPAIEVLLVPPTVKKMPSITSLLEELPCGCVLEEDKKKPKQDDMRDLITDALHLLVQTFANEVQSLRTAICVLFKTIQNTLPEKRVKSPHDCAGLQVLASCFRYCMLDQAYIETLLDTDLPQDIKESVVMLAESTYHVLTSEVLRGSRSSHGTPRNIPSVASSFLRHNKQWVTEQVQTITDFLNQEGFDDQEMGVFTGAPEDFIHQTLSMQANHILSQAKGRMYLQHIHNVIIGNVDWLQKQLDIQPLLPVHEPPQDVEFSFNPTLGVNEFNPVEAFNQIGTSKFDHLSIDGFTWDWHRLLQSDLGLSEINFKSLLYHRHELQDGAYLEENEKRPVEVLRAKFDNEPADLV
ncbi:unnamed protein product [Owenia fusiformis]|uniref:KIAA0825 n=2 Tax=Owenia fusiformis TaxID=6347 RepID=A0A8S4PVD5_OWEFU|nr:unnamed protein product [Owenia fusiformis]